MRRKIIPYNQMLMPLAKKLRASMTFSEVKLWNELKNGKLLGYDFDRQRVIGNYIVDFYCKDLQLAIEVDGITHHGDLAIAKDFARQKELEAAGVRFLRFDALLVINNVEVVVEDILKWIVNFEENNGASEFALRKRAKIASKRHPPPPPQGGES